MARAKKSDEPVNEIDLAKKLGFVQVTDSEYNHISDMVPTFIPWYDYILGGGIPFNRMTEVFAPEQVGKSTFMIGLTRILNVLGVQVYWIDTEGTADRDRLQELHVDTTKTFVSKPEKDDMTVEGVGEAMENIIKAYSSTEELKKTPIVVIWDSIGGTISQAEADISYEEEGQRGRTAAAVTKLVKKTKAILGDANISLIFINQVRQNQNMMNKYDQKFTRPGGEALNHFCSLRLELRKGAQIKDKENVYGGHILRMVTDKSKQSRPHQKAEGYLMAGMIVGQDANGEDVTVDGLDYEYNIYMGARNLNLITTGGSYRKYVTLNGEEINMYENDFITYLKQPEGKELRKELFQRQLFHYFPTDFKPLHNRSVDVTKWPDMKGVKEHYKELQKAGGKA